MQWGGPVWEVNWPSKDQEQAFVKEPGQGFLRLTSSCKTSSRFPGQGKGEGRARFRKHSYCIPTVLPRHSLECPSSSSGQACLGLSTQLTLVRPCASNAPLSLSEDLWTKKAVDRFCGLQCGLFPGFCLLFPPLCYIHEFRISILC